MSTCPIELLQKNKAELATKIEAVTQEVNDYSAKLKQAEEALNILSKNMTDTENLIAVASGSSVPSTVVTRVNVAPTTRRKSRGSREYNKYSLSHTVYVFSYDLYSNKHRHFTLKRSKLCQLIADNDRKTVFTLTYMESIGMVELSRDDQTIKSATLVPPFTDDGHTSEEFLKFATAVGEAGFPCHYASVSNEEACEMARNEALKVPVTRFVQDFTSHAVQPILRPFTLAELPPPPAMLEPADHHG